VTGAVVDAPHPAAGAIAQVDQFWPRRSREQSDPLTGPKQFVDVTRETWSNLDCQPMGRQLSHHRMFDPLADPAGGTNRLTRSLSGPPGCAARAVAGCCPGYPAMQSVESGLLPLCAAPAKGKACRGVVEKRLPYPTERPEEIT